MIVWQSNTKEILPFDVYLFKSRVLRALFHLCIFYLSFFFFFYTSSTASYRDWCLATTLVSSRMEIINRNFIWALLFHSQFFFLSPFHPKSMMTIKHNDTCVMRVPHKYSSASPHSMEWISFIFLSVTRTHHLFSNKYPALLQSSDDAQHSLRISIELKRVWASFSPHKWYAIIFFLFILHFLYTVWSHQMMSAWDCMNEKRWALCLADTLTHVDVRWLIQSDSHVINVQNIFR